MPTVVVLPAPFGPSRPKISPDCTRRSSDTTAWMSPGNVFESPLVVMTSPTAQMPPAPGAAAPGTPTAVTAGGSFSPCSMRGPRSGQVECGGCRRRRSGDSDILPFLPRRALASPRRRSTRSPRRERGTKDEYDTVPRTPHSRTERSSMTNDPYDRVPQAPSFRITSEDVLDGQPMPRRNASETAGGENVSPQLSWYDFPPETRSFVVTMYDADAPTPSGFWHWAVADIPGDVRALPPPAGSALTSPGMSATAQCQKPLGVGASASYIVTTKLRVSGGKPCQESCGETFSPPAVSLAFRRGTGCPSSTSSLVIRKEGT